MSELVEIKGLGDVAAKFLEEKLNVTTFKQLAGLTDEQVNEASDTLKRTSVNKVTSWVEEAKERAETSKPEVKDETDEPEVKDETDEPEVKDETDEPEVKDETSKPEVTKEAIEQYAEIEAVKLLENGHSRSGILARAASKFKVERRDVLKKIDASISLKDNLLECFKKFFK